MNSAPPPFQPPIPQPEKKGIPPIGWVGIGCGSILLLGIIAAVVVFFIAKRTFDEATANPEKFAAELIVKANPELEKVSNNDGKGEMTVRTKDGKEFTVSYKDLADGKLSLKDGEGNITQLGANDLSGLPSWVPVLPGIVGEPNAFVSGNAGSYSVTTSESKDALITFMQVEAGKLGFNSSSNSFTNLGGVATSTNSFSDSSREFSLIISDSGSSPIHATVSFKQK